MITLIQDLRYAFRRLRQAPGFSVVCIITLALGIGANTAIFTLVNAVMLKSLPVSDPKTLYRLGNVDNCCVIGGMQGSWSIYSYALYKQFRDHTPEFSELAAFQGGLSELSVRRSETNSPAEPFQGEFVSGNYFNMFGIGAAVGRPITPEDDKPGAPPVAMISYRVWQQHFGLDPSVIGASFSVNTVPYTVVGVAPAGFFGDQLRPNPPDFWMPLATEPELSGGNELLNLDDLHWLYAIGRIKPGANSAAVQSELTTELRHWIAARPHLSDHDRGELNKQQIVLAPGGAGITNMADQSASGLRLLMVLSGFVLLIACANIANLMLARGASNRAETAIRVALGAPRRRLIRQVITESVLLAFVGGAAGLAVAYAGTRAILLMAFRGAQFIPISASPSLPVLGFAFLLSLATGVVFGVAPAWVNTHSHPAEALHGLGRSTGDHSSIARKALVVVQVALSTLLLIGAGLLTKTLRHLEDQQFGFETQGRLIVRTNPTLAGYKPEGLYALYQQLQQRLPQIPGVTNASYSLYSPMRGDNWSFGISIEGHPPGERIFSSFDRIGPQYFETLGTRLLRGRTITEEDTPTSRHVAVVNQAFVKKFFAKEDPIGKHFGMGGAKSSGDMEIVGVVEDQKYQDARSPAYPTFFMPFLQMPSDPELAFTMGSNFAGDIELQVAGKPENLEASVRRVLAEINPDLTVLDMVSLPEQVSRNFNQDRLIARLTELYGILALILACVGLYGVTAYSVARRTSEIGIRMALGATRSNVLRLVLRGALIQIGIGLAIALPAALGGGKFLASQLYGVTSRDPATLAIAAGSLIICSSIAAFIPARRAASIEPMRALRME
jgi:predicted permease